MTSTNNLNLDTSYYNTANSAQSSKKSGDSNSVVNKDEFLQLLILQLKNQDPLDPMENEDFAINLAQFSQLEQLISINDTLEKKSSDDQSIQGLASYLGHTAVLNDSTIHVADNDGGQISFKLPKDATDVIVNLVDENQNIVEQVSLGEQAKGEYTVNLNDLTTSSGDYQASVYYQTSDGEGNTVDYNVCGVISGFIPGESEKPLMIGNTQIALSDIKEVRS